MRLMFAIAALALTATHAAAEEDRYGPSRSSGEDVRASGAAPSANLRRAPAAPYQGPLLSWAGKVEPNSAGAPAPRVLRPVPSAMVSPPAEPARTQAPARMAAQTAPTGYEPVEIRRGYRPAAAMAPPAEPQSLYSPPSATPPPSPRAQPRLAFPDSPPRAAQPMAMAAPPTAAPAPAPAQRRAPAVSTTARMTGPAVPPALAAAPAPSAAAAAPSAVPPYDPTRPWARLGMSSAPADPAPPAAPGQAAAQPAAGAQPAGAVQATPASSGVVGGRFYSVHRAFGEQPDPIPTPDRSAGPVLVGPGQPTQIPATADMAAGGVGAEPDASTQAQRRGSTSSSSSN